MKNQVKEGSFFFFGSIVKSVYVDITISIRPLPWELVIAITYLSTGCDGDPHIEQENTAAKHWGKWEMWTWQLLCSRIWHVVAGEPCATVPMHLIHSGCLFIWPWCIPVWQTPVHSHQHPAQYLYFSLTLEQCFIQASSGFHSGRPATSLPFIVLHPLHNFPQTYYNTVFFSFFTVLISSFEQFSLVLGSAALRDEVFKAEAMSRTLVEKCD